MNLDFSTKSKKDKENYRSLFCRDKDRIIYSKDFLRLGGKTQIFVNGYDDHMRNRFSHTLEVVQIAKKIGNSLKLNIELIEAIAFGHDIGHTPFGHAGERVLNKLMNGCYKINGFSITPIDGNHGFKHNWQGLRVVRDLNRKYDGEIDLELSKYTEWGILKHTKLRYNTCDRIIKNDFCGNNYDHDEICKSKDGFNIDFYEKLYGDVDDIDNLSLEGIVVEKADEIAQRHHDIEDGIVANLVNINDIVEKLPKETDNVYERLFDEEKKLIKDLSNPNIKLTQKIKILSHLMHGIYSRDLITNSLKNIKSFINKHNINNNFDFQSFKEQNKGKIIEKDYFNLIDFSFELKEIDKKLKKYLKNAILKSIMAQGMDSKAEYIILKLVSIYLRYPQYLPNKTISDILKRISNKHSDVVECDKISDIRDFISNEHFKKLHNSTYLNYFLRGICDFIAGMTDDFAYKQFELAYGTKKISNKAL